VSGSPRIGLAQASVFKTCRNPEVLRDLERRLAAIEAARATSRGSADRVRLAGLLLGTLGSRRHRRAQATREAVVAESVGFLTRSIQTSRWKPWTAAIPASAGMTIGGASTSSAAGGRVTTVFKLRAICGDELQR